MNNLTKRILVGIVALPILFLSIWNNNPYYFGTIVTIAALLATQELFAISEKIGCKPFKFVGYIFALGILILSCFASIEKIVIVFVLLPTTMMIISVFQSKTREDFKQVLISNAVTSWGIIYVAVLSSFLIRLKIEATQFGSALLSIFFMITMAGDTFAYFVGRIIGKHKLAPSISPGKTVEGSIGGIFGSILFAILAQVWFFAKLPVLHAIALAIILNIVGQVGDLFESILKRGSDTKDAASIIPGHGGLLDRLDSLLFGAPIIYYYYIYFLSKHL